MATAEENFVHPYMFEPNLDPELASAGDNQPPPQMYLQQDGSES